MNTIDTAKNKEIQSDILMLLFRKNHYSKMQFIVSTEKGKAGKEVLYNCKMSARDENNNIYEEKETEIEVKDLFGENRRTYNVVGTTLVNLINNSQQILNICDYYLKITDSDIKDYIKKLYDVIYELYYKNNIDKINLSDRSSIYMQIEDLTENVLYNNDKVKYITKLDLINGIDISTIKHKNKNDVKHIFKFLQEIYSISDIDKIENQVNDIVFNIFMNDITLNTLEYTYTSILSDILKNMEKGISNILKQYDFVINNFIKQFTYDLEYIYEKHSRNEILKNLYTIDSLSKTSGYVVPTYFEEILEYYNTNYNENTHLQDIIKIFITSIKKDIDFMEQRVLLNLLNDEYYAIPKSIITNTLIPDIYYKDDELNAKSYIYTVYSLKDFLNISMYHLEMNNRTIIKCHNCKRYFVSDVRNNEVFCGRTDYKDKRKRTCKIVGKQKIDGKENNISIETKNIHKRIYNRLKKKEDKTEFNNYMNAYHKIRKEIEEREHDKSEWKKELHKWLKSKENELNTKKKK